MRLDLRAVGEREWNVAWIVGIQTAEHGARQRQIVADVRRHYRDLARLQRRVEASAVGAAIVEHRAQAIVQNFDFAQLRMTGVDLYRRIVVRPRFGNRRGAMQHIVLQATQQGVAAGIDEAFDLRFRLHDLVGKQLRQNFAPAAAPRRQRRVVALQIGKRRRQRSRAIAAQTRAQRFDIAPVFRRRRRQIKIQCAPLPGDRQHVQHVRRHMDGAEGCEPRW